MTTPYPGDAGQHVANLEAARVQLVSTVLQIRARYESSGPSWEGQQLISAAVRDLEEVDSKLNQIRKLG